MLRSPRETNVRRPIQRYKIKSRMMPVAISSTARGAAGISLAPIRTGR